MSEFEFLELCDRLIESRDIADLPLDYEFDDIDYEDIIFDMEDFIHA